MSDSHMVSATDVTLKVGDGDTSIPVTEAGFEWSEDLNTTHTAGPATYRGSWSFDMDSDSGLGGAFSLGFLYGLSVAQCHESDRNVERDTGIGCGVSEK